MPRFPAWALAASGLLVAGFTNSKGDDAPAIFPPVVRLDGFGSAQRVLVEARAQGAFVDDRTASAIFQVVNPQIARIGADGVVVPVSDGTTMLRATVNGRTVEATVVVSNAATALPRSFTNHVLPVFAKTGCNQGACHGAAAGKNGFRLTLRGYGPEIDHAAITRQALGRRIVRTAPAESLLLLKPTGAVEHGGGVRFAVDSLEYRVIADWIAEGAPPPSKADAKLKGLEVFPKAVRLAKGDKQSLIVLARYDDGRIDDVTRWAKFTSTDDGVAKVDESGRISVEGQGEASVSVWFAGLVASTTVTSPYDRKVDAKVYAQADRHNRIDELNLEKLRSLNIPPAVQADDAAFLRRASLDATGELPTVAQVDAFLADRDPSKRAKLVERLLASEAFVDYWTYKWSDLFLVSSKKLPASAMWAFHRFIRESVEVNKGWDALCRDVVTAKGSTLSNGAANYFVLHRDPIDLTENASMAFLGLAMTCARCHNHPMEKWTQDQYYGMANLFARVRIKDGPTTGDAVVTASPEGDIPHPRSGAIVPPTPLDGRALAVSDRRDRREAFADWLVAPENPYFAKAAVNRIWRNFFSRGLVDPEDDLRATNPASDEALLAWLVDDFKANKYDVKHLIRTIMNSAVYQRSSDPAPGDDSDAKFLARSAPRRLPAEVLLDAIARATGVPTDFGGYPSGWRSLQLPDSKPESGFLDAFGRPERLNTCSCERSSEPSMSQALHLANGGTLNEKLRDPRSFAAKDAEEASTDGEIVDRLFKAALSRPPTKAESKRMRGVLADALNGSSDPKAARRQAVEDLYWAVLTSKEFLFNH